jgi:hypothetical protein
METQNFTTGKITTHLKGHFHEKFLRLILISAVLLLRFCMLGGSGCKTGSPDLPEPAAARRQNSYTCRSTASYSSSVTLIYAKRESAKLTRGVDVLQRHAQPYC